MCFRNSALCVPQRRAASAFLLLIALAVTRGALAHHGLGRFDRTKPVQFTGTITSIDFVNPHSYLHFDAVDGRGRALPMRCEMRAATLLRRSGWSEAMFAKGAHVVVDGFAHRDDPASCYLEDIKIGDGPDINRNAQLELTTRVDLAARPKRTPDGKPNLAGDWAQEQYVVAVPPGGRGGRPVPKSLIGAVESGQLTLADVPPSGWDAQPVKLTPRGEQEAAAFEMWSPEDNPRLRCRPTSILFDWVFDGAVNRIEQRDGRIVIDYGLYSFRRVVHMNMTQHPVNAAPTYAGHSIGRWEGDVLVIDTVGFLPGVLVPPLRHSGELHVVERLEVDTEKWTLTRHYVAEDPVYFAEPYTGSDTVLVADVPYVAHPCDELTYEFRRDAAR